MRFTVMGRDATGRMHACQVEAQGHANVKPQ
jgi:hypothetical protein